MREDPRVEPEEHLLGLIEEWSSVVAEIEQGYKFTIYDYINDIAKRDDIAEMLHLLTEAGKGALAELVDPIDERFLQATREVPLSVSYPSAEPRDRWWWYRIPKRLGEDLASDLRSMGLLESTDQEATIWLGHFFLWNGAYGYEYIPFTGLYHVGSREYDPRTERWLQRDPIDVAGGHPNVYLYCGNDPLNAADPYGLWDWAKYFSDVGNVFV